VCVVFLFNIVEDVRYKLDSVSSGIRSIPNV